MSKLARALLVAGMLAAMNLAAMTAVAHAQPPTHPSSRQADATVQRLLARERFTVPDQGPANPRLLLEEPRSSLLNLPDAAPAQAAGPVRAAEHRGRPGWLASALAALVLGVTLGAGAAVLATRRTNRIHRAGSTA